ncbi:MAG: hypothetical protein NXI30_25665 [bacterium]|nr:hypothetical protein [bacterium]
MQTRPRVGEILVSAGIIDELQLDAALGEQKRWGRRLGVTLIKMGMVEEGHLIRALAKQLDLPVASLAGKRIPEDVIALVPGRMASEHGVIPLFTKDGGRNGQLYLGMEDPSNLAVLDDLAFRTGMEIHPVMVGPTELGEAIDRYYHARNGGAPQQDPFKTGEPMNPGSLRVVTDDSPQPGTAPAEPSIEREVKAAASGYPMPALTPPIELNDAVEPAPSAATETWAMPEDPTADLARIDEALEALRSDVTRVSDEVAGVRENVTGVQGRVETVQSTVTNVQSDVLRIRDEVAGEQSDREDPGPVRNDVARLQEDVSKLGDALAVLRGEFERLSQDLGSEPAGTTAATEMAARASEETERTRIVAKAITTLLVEKGVLGLDALQAQISLLKAAAEADDTGGDLEPLDD